MKKSVVNVKCSRSLDNENNEASLHSVFIYLMLRNAEHGHLCCKFISRLALVQPHRASYILAIDLRMS